MDAIEKFPVREQIRNRGSSWSEMSLSLSFNFLISKGHYTLMLPPHPPLFVSMSLDVSTKSQRVAPQARKRYLVICIEIYGPK